ncbi:hypothetical protein BDZ90DRAFT_279860 [Jaminaea rosea]|uniref:Dienelactone hydrolase domain-containing protein n=1 Tax=Jaminaea rosea TaxID=1569628 RepID=A0A316UQF0_9BASI|nr:hypothetical protein BDZ90DRAFT_279860 [Jaminaea rosea]PWN27527.1 hypothetical protein BDZ90DRAFT_279860 [Jaminaea rosea]
MSSGGFCHKCVELPGELKGTPKGSVKTVGGIQSYVSQPGSAKGNIVLFTDIFGLAIQNPRIIADELQSQTGMTVTVPDVFLGEPMSVNDFVVNKSTDEPAPSDEQMQKNMGKLMEWAGSGHSPNETYPRAKQVIEALSGEGKVQAVGFCYGGKLCSRAAQDGIVSSVSIYHPAMLEAEEAKQVKVPVLLNMADGDFAFDSVQGDWEKTLKEKNLLDSRSKQYKKTTHGFGCRPPVDNAEVYKAYQDALATTASFFKEHA